MKKILWFAGLLMSGSVFATPTILVASYPASCFGICDGQAIVSVTSGIGPYTYLWAPSGGTNSLETGLCAGTYTVTVTDTGDMSTATATVVVSQPTALSIVPISPGMICYGDTASVTPMGSGGTPPYSYVWTGFTGVPTLTVWPTSTTSYTITVSDANGCTVTGIATVPVNPAITVNATSTNTSGCVICDGTVSCSPIGGTGAFTYLWSPTGSTTPTYSGVCAGSYTVTIVDAAGCAETDSTIVFANNSTIANFTMVPDSTDAYNVFAFNSSVGTGNSYSWEWGDGTPFSTIANPTHYYPVPGVYNVCLIASNFLCGADTLCQPVVITGTLATCNALFNVADDTLNPDPNAHYVYNLSYGTTLSYLWDFGDGTTSTSMTPSHVYAGTGPYLLCLSINNGSGCTDMYCDSLISADSLNREGGTMQLTVFDQPTYYSTATGVSSSAHDQQVSVAPNPFSGTTVFTVDSKEAYTFELCDVIGKKVKSINGLSEKQFEVSREGLQSGIYFYKLYSREGIIGTGKLVIR